MPSQAQKFSTRKKLAKLTENKLYSKAVNEISKSIQTNTEDTETLIQKWTDKINSHTEKSMPAEPRIFCRNRNGYKNCKRTHVTR